MHGQGNGSSHQPWLPPSNNSSSAGYAFLTRSSSMVPDPEALEHGSLPRAPTAALGAAVPGWGVPAELEAQLDSMLGFAGPASGSSSGLRSASRQLPSAAQVVALLQSPARSGTLGVSGTFGALSLGPTSGGCGTLSSSSMGPLGAGLSSPAPAAAPAARAGPQGGSGPYDMSSMAAAVAATLPAMMVDMAQATAACRSGGGQTGGGRGGFGVPVAPSKMKRLSMTPPGSQELSQHLHRQQPMLPPTSSGGLPSGTNAHSGSGSFMRHEVLAAAAAAQQQQQQLLMAAQQQQMQMPAGIPSGAGGSSGGGVEGWDRPQPPQGGKGGGGFNPLLFEGPSQRQRQLQQLQQIMQYAKPLQLQQIRRQLKQQQQHAQQQQQQQAQQQQQQQRVQQLGGGDRQQGPVLPAGVPDGLVAEVASGSWQRVQPPAHGSVFNSGDSGGGAGGVAGGDGASTSHDSGHGGSTGTQAEGPARGALPEAEEQAEQGESGVHPRHPESRMEGGAAGLQWQASGAISSLDEFDTVSLDTMSQSRSTPGNAPGPSVRGPSTRVVRDPSSSGAAGGGGGPAARRREAAPASTSGPASGSAPAAATKSGRPRQRARNNATLADVIRFNLLQPGPHKVLIGNQDTVEIVVSVDGRIETPFGEFRSLSSMALAALRKRNPNRLACDGWQEVKLNGVRLDDMRQEAGRLLLTEGGAAKEEL
ncbi:hypothetical protein GPECTOR_50g565 [Gonium pectorale]|uniref:RAMA domain-containing protein n=1 Tax=Gonium pectorale TaxID=33097 RepID=A0A150G7F0_GONPE|nr:hypothetical protein GPECTOR_50g565 [Gonium pectorale]|eukprot:KXZ45772.1 hypothetical protein GPECTOR_50g565 [Gonium pectorale]